MKKFSFVQFRTRDGRTLVGRVSHVSEKSITVIAPYLATTHRLSRENVATWIVLGNDYPLERAIEINRRSETMKQKFLRCVDEVARRNEIREGYYCNPSVSGEILPWEEVCAAG